jgi:homoserine kinase type II
VLEAWGLPDPDRVTLPERGTNNDVLLVELDGRRVVVRRHLNSAPDAVRREHALLQRLAGDPGLDLEVPLPLPTSDGDTLVVERTGTPLAMYAYIEGERPTKSLASLPGIGAAIGRLTRALAKCPQGLAPVTWRDRALEALHPGVDDVDSLVRDLRRLLPDETGLAWLAESWRASDADVRRQTGGLPHQIVHGDLALSNLLTREGAVTGVLDFEIAGWDLRVSEIVTAVVQICDTVASGPAEARALMDGYRRHVDLSKDELAAIPVLVRRRALGTVVWRAGRWRRGQATLDEVAARLRDGERIEAHLDDFRLG